MPLHVVAWTEASLNGLWLISELSVREQMPGYRRSYVRRCLKHTLVWNVIRTLSVVWIPYAIAGHPVLSYHIIAWLRETCLL